MATAAATAAAPVPTSQFRHRLRCVSAARWARIFSLALLRRAALFFPAALLLALELELELPFRPLPVDLPPTATCVLPKTYALRT
jgi:hypothetical protein